MRQCAATCNAGSANILLSSGLVKIDITCSSGSILDSLNFEWWWVGLVFSFNLYNFY